MKSWDVVGYIYAADEYCDGCILDAVKAHNSENFLADRWHSLDDAAADLGIDDVEDETAFDSGDFPKVIFADSACDSHCSACHEPLAGEVI